MDTPGSGDCEARDAWGQSVLATTSAAYVVAGATLLIWAHRRRDTHPAEVWLYALGLVAAGLGSIDYHGPALGPEPLLHDGGLALALTVALGIDLRRLGAPDRAVLGGLVGLLAVMLVAIAIEPALSPALAGVAALGLIGTEALVYRRRLRPATPAIVAAAVCLGAGGAIFALSRTSGPLCDPTSWFQGHGVWHVLTAAALALWGVASLPDRSLSGSPGTVVG